MTNPNSAGAARPTLLTEAVTLENAYVRLEPLSLEHADGLTPAAEGPERLWYTFVPGRDQVVDDIRQRLTWRDQGHMNPWVVRDLTSGEVAGETTFCNIDQANRHV